MAIRCSFVAMGHRRSSTRHVVVESCGLRSMLLAKASVGCPRRAATVSAIARHHCCERCPMGVSLLQQTSKLECECNLMTAARPSCVPQQSPAAWIASQQPPPNSWAGGGKAILLATCARCEQATTKRKHSVRWFNDVNDVGRRFDGEQATDRSQQPAAATSDGLTPRAPHRCRRCRRRASSWSQKFSAYLEERWRAVLRWAAKAWP